MKNLCIYHRNCADGFGAAVAVKQYFKNQPERLKFIGKKGNWNQFEKIGEWGVWAELLDSDLHLIELTQK